MEPLPERFLRGLRDKDFVVRDETGGFIAISERAYELNPKSRNPRLQKGKSDHYEISINWEDELVESFRILKEDTNNAAFGIVIIRLEDLETARAANPLATHYLSWERDALDENPYHGNLLISGNILPKPQSRQLAAVIASYVYENLIFVEPENYESELDNRIETVAERLLQQRPVQSIQAIGSSSISQPTESQPSSTWQQFKDRLRSFFKS